MYIIYRSVRKKEESKCAVSVPILEKLSRRVLILDRRYMLIENNCVFRLSAVYMLCERWCSCIRTVINFITRSNFITKLYLRVGLVDKADTSIFSRKSRHVDFNLK